MSSRSAIQRWNRVRSGAKCAVVTVFSGHGVEKLGNGVLSGDFSREPTGFKIPVEFRRY